MRTCPVCGRQYEPPAQFCQVDGVALRIDVPTTDPYLGTKILEQFRLDRIIGAGGMGIVYEGWNDALSRRVAVKILHRDLVTNKDIVTRFHREAQIASQLDHPGIVRVILFGQLADGNLYLVLEFLEGPTLAEALEKDGSFSLDRTVRTMGQVADAIGYAHQKGIIHRDLKPENVVMTTREGEEIPKVLDFGIAKFLVGAASFVTQSGLIFGTARYISPEGAAGEKVDQRSDVYSLGVMTYELLAGRAPFEADEPVQLLVKHMHEVPAPLRKWGPATGVPQVVEDVVMRALAKNADARQENAAVFARALREAFAEWQGTPIRSVIPTAAMSLNITRDSQPMRPPNTLAPAEPSIAPEPTFADPAPMVHPTPVVNGSMRAGTNGAMVPAHSTQLPPREEFPAVDPRTVAPPPRPPETAAPVLSSPATVAMPELVARQLIPLDDDIQVSGLPTRRPSPPPPTMDEYQPLPRRRSAWRSLGVIVLAASLAAGMVGGGAWAMRVFPSQRRADDVAHLLQRANDAMVADRLSRTSNGYSVEDYTDRVLAIEPDNVRARQLRRSAAVRLSNAATRARNDHHPELAIPMLESALRLMEDAALRQDLATTQQEVEQMRAPATPARPRPAPRAPVPPPVTAPVPARPAAPTAVTPTTTPAPAARPTASTASTRRRASSATPTAEPTEPGVTFTPGRSADAATENTQQVVVPTPFGPLPVTFPRLPFEPEPAPGPALGETSSSVPHTGEF